MSANNFKTYKFHIRTKDKTDKLTVHKQLPNDNAVKPFAEFCLNTTKGVKEVKVTDKNDNFVLLYAEN